MDPVLYRYQRLIDISRDLASTLDLDTLLARIVLVAAELSGADAASILLYDEMNNQLYFQASSDMENHPIMRGMLVPGNGSLAGWVIQNHKPVIVNDVQNDERHYDHVDDQINFSTHSLMGIPLISRDKVIGVLEIINKLKGIFTIEDQDLMTIVGAQAAIAIQNTRLFQQSDLISEMVHEIRTPLSSLSAIAHILSKQAISDEQRNKLFKTLESEVQRLNVMTTSFLDLARLESGRVIFHPSTIEVKPLLEECVTVCQNKADENQLTIRTVVVPDMPSLEADRDKIKQVILNLLSNAIKYLITGHFSSPQEKKRPE